MASLSDYPLTPGYGFGSTNPPYSASKPHHGIDIGAPLGTDIIVGGLLLGTVGDTGAADGYHCHVDKNRNYPTSVNYVDPSDWRTIQGSVVFAANAGTAGNMVVVQATNGYYYRFLHMNAINAKIGDKVGMEPLCTLAQAQAMAFAFEGANGYYGKNALAGELDAELNKYVAGVKTVSQALGDFYNSSTAQDYRNRWFPEQMEKANASGGKYSQTDVTQSGNALYKKVA